MGRASEEQIITYGDLNSIINASTSVTATGYNYAINDNEHLTETSYTLNSGYKTVVSGSNNFNSSLQYNFDFTINDRFHCFNLSNTNRFLKWTNKCNIYFYNSSSGYVLVKECIETGVTSTIEYDEIKDTILNTNIKVSANSSDFSGYGTIVFSHSIGIDVSGGPITSGHFSVFYTGTTNFNTVSRCAATYGSGTLSRFLTYTTIKNLGMSTSLYVLQNSGRTTQMVVYHDFYKARSISTQYTSYSIANSAGAYVSVKTTGYTTDRIETITSTEISGLPSWLYFNGYSGQVLTFVAASKTTSARNANITVTPRDCRTGTTFNISQSP